MMEEMETGMMEEDHKEEPAPVVNDWYKNISLEDAKAMIRARIVSSARDFVAIGYFLKHIRDNRMFEEEGYTTIWEFAKEEYGLSKSTASRYMTMNDRFSREGNSPVIDRRYQEFGKSQLQEMLYLNDEQMEQVTPNMQVLEIREVGKPEEQEEQVPGQMDITEFPEYLPDPMFSADEFGREPEMTAPVVKETFRISIEDFIGTCEQQTAAKLQQIPESVAISQQEEPVPDETEADAEDVIDGEFTEIDDAEPEVKPAGQPELPALKNNDQRAAFLDAYETWPLWIETVQTGERYYRYDLADGTSMVVKVYHAMLFDYKASGVNYEECFREGYGKHEYYLLLDGKFFRDCDCNRSYLIEKLKDIQKK